MAIPPCGTFQYVAVVPESRDAPWQTRLSVPVKVTGDDLRDDRLVGHSPTLEMSDAEIMSDVRRSPLAGIAVPEVLRCRISLTAEARQHDTIASAAFHVDRSFMTVLSPGDALFMARTASGGLAVSIHRNGELVAAAGAVSAVPLGESVQVHRSEDGLKDFERLLREGRDPELESGEQPMEIRFDTHAHRGPDLPRHRCRAPSGRDPR